MVDVAVRNNLCETLEQELGSMVANARIQRALMSSDEQLAEFVKRCNQRGVKYCPGRRDWPSHLRLSLYCGCVPSTILRIETGGTKFASRVILEVLNAIACISPPAFSGDDHEESLARIADADRWVSSDPDTRGEIWPAIRAGISKRIALSTPNYN